MMVLCSPPARSSRWLRRGNGSGHAIFIGRQRTVTPDRRLMPAKSGNHASSLAVVIRRLTATNIIPNASFENNKFRCVKLSTDRRCGQWCST
mmetsp:Transcript_40723/g.85025  ORF Transcript_40723/g.85025 Transcript_40723/m.85025 type:complete len:92 (-) Transcript_40723:29-304(-)